MSNVSDRHTSETAISEVLRAERNALAGITACESEAEEILREARAAVRDLVRRTQRRVSGLHAGCGARTRELVTALERDAAAAVEQATAHGDDRVALAAAVQAVARELTRPESGHDG